MRSLSPRARSWVGVALPLLAALAACDRTPTEPFSMPFEAAKGGGGSGAGKAVVERIAFASQHQGFMGIYVVDPNGQSPATLVTTPPSCMSDGEPSLSPGATKVAFTRSNTCSETAEIVVSTLNGSTVTQITNFGVRSQSPVFSPNGSKIAFVSDKPHPGAVASVNVFVMNADGSNVQLVDSTSRGSRPAWSADGKTLYYVFSDYVPNQYYNFASWIATKHLISGIRNFIYGCPNAVCTNPTVDYNTGRVMFEYQEPSWSVPNLFMIVNDSTVLTNFGLPPASVGGWSKDGTKYVFAPALAPGWPVSSALQILDVTTVGSGNVSISDLPTAATWASAPTWSR